RPTRRLPESDPAPGLPRLRAPAPGLEAGLRAPRAHGPATDPRRAVPAASRAAHLLQPRLLAVGAGRDDPARRLPAGADAGLSDGRRALYPVPRSLPR